MYDNDEDDDDDDSGDCGDVNCDADVTFKGLGLAVFTVVAITLLVVKLQPKVLSKSRSNLERNLS